MFRILFFISLLLIISSCSSNCNCSSSEKLFFKNELENHFLELVKENEINCVLNNDYWLINWNQKRNQETKNWDLIIDSNNIYQTGSISVQNITKVDIPVISQFIRRIRINGYDISYISKDKKNDNIYSFQILDEDKTFMVSQSYEFNNGNWKLIGINKVWKEIGENFDYSNLKKITSTSQQ